MNDYQDYDNFDVSTVQCKKKKQILLCIQNFLHHYILVSTQLCDEVALQLTKAANNVVELYRRLTDVDAASSSEQMANVQKTDMVKNLEMSIIRTQKMLQDLTFERLKQSNGGVDINQTDTVKKLNDLVAKEQMNDPKRVITMMQQYSDILLGMMQQKIQNSGN